jgi:sigma-B regulation protein RsbU (phosphoserine phosphatase)
MTIDHDGLKTENERLKSALRELSILNEISSFIGSPLPIGEVSQRIIKKVVTALQAQEAAIFLFSENAGQQPHTFVRGKLDSTSISKTRMDIAVAGWIAHHKQPLVINDPAHDERFQNVLIGESRMESLLAVPLIAKGKLIGALAVFNSLRSGKFVPDDVRLLSIIGSQSAQSLENARLYEEELRLKQIQGELDAARKIQEGFLPAAVPTLDGFDIFGMSIPAKEVGGDLFDFIQPAANRLYFSIGDVSGKGLPAAMLMATIQAQVRLLVTHDPFTAPDTILNDINKITCQMASSIQFVTMIVGVVEPIGGTVTLSNCAHCFPIVVRSEGGLAEMNDSQTVLGKFPDIQPTATGVTLQPGDLLACASDGIDEAFDAQGEQFGQARLVTSLAANRHQPAADICRTMMCELASFRGAAEQSDDITLVIIKRL